MWTVELILNHQGSTVGKINALQVKEPGYLPSIPVYRILYPAILFGLPEAFAGTLLRNESVSIFGKLNCCSDTV